MRILALNSSDISGGAARAAYRLHVGLNRNGIHSRMLVGSKYSQDPDVVLPLSFVTRFLLGKTLYCDKLPRLFYPERQRTIWSTGWFPTGLAREMNRFDADIVHLHWLGYGFLSVEELARVRRPLVWTLHDMWAFTGGCHYDQDCGRYQESCGSCPQLQSKRAWDLSRWTLDRKHRAWKDLNLTLVCPSRWMARCAAASSLFRDRRIEVIPNGLDLTVFCPIDRAAARQALGLPLDKKLVLFGAMGGTSDPRKGFSYLHSALRRLAAAGWGEHTHLVVFGSEDKTVGVDWGLPAHSLGFMGEDVQLARLYAAADVFVAPSVQEALSNMLMEALACGTPCVAFDTGGPPDLIEHGGNGYLARPLEVEDLARGIADVLRDRTHWSALCRNARDTAESRFDLKHVARLYRSLYQEIANRRSSPG